MIALLNLGLILDKDIIAALTVVVVVVAFVIRLEMREKSAAKSLERVEQWMGITDPEKGSVMLKNDCRNLRIMSDSNVDRIESEVARQGGMLVGHETRIAVIESRLEG